MSKKERILRPVKRIGGGTILPHRKHTAEVETIPMPPPDRVCIPLHQNIGAPSEPIVQKGDEVFVGSMLAKAGGYVGVPVHSSVSGTVEDIKEISVGGKPTRCVVVASDGKMTACPDLSPVEVNDGKDLAAAALGCGLVGLGGAGFPTHVKLSPPEGVKIDTLVVNGAECEPYLTGDYRECMENYNDIIEGIYLIKKVMGLEKVVICVEGNKPRAIEKLYRIATDHRDSDDNVKLMRLPSSYPQGAEKVIIYSATGRVLPAGKLPSDIGCIVMNITSIGVLYRYITTGMPLVSRRVTVDGTDVKEPKNIMVPIGTCVKDILDFAGVPHEDGKIIIGGPMMGGALVDETAVIEKRAGAILVMRDEKPDPVTPCIRCGRCARACPMGLTPARVEAVLNSDNLEALGSLNTALCMECGSCAFVCPAKRPLAQVMRSAKSYVRRGVK